MEQGLLEHRKKESFSLFSYLWAFTLLGVLFIALLLIWATHPKVMTNYFLKYSQAEQGGVSPGDYPYIAQTITRYLKGQNPSMDISLPIGGTSQKLFNQKELLHMQDIRALIHLGTIILTAGALFLAFLLIFYAKSKKIRLLTRALYKSCMAMFLLIIFLGLWAVIDFNSLFIVFHQLLFTNDLWLLNPLKDRLIQLMPLDFFVQYAKTLILSYLLLLGFLFTAAVAATRIFSPKKE